MSKRNTVRILWIFLAAMLLITVMPHSASAASVKKITLLSGQTKKLNRKNAVWVSRNNAVAEVSQTGLVTAKRAGKATVTAKVGKKRYRYKITVEAPYLTKQSSALALKKSTTLRVRGTSKAFRLVSSDSSIVKVKKKGKNKYKITALKDGVATVTAQYQDQTLTCLVTAGKGNIVLTRTGTFTLSYNGTVVQTLTYDKSDVGRYVSSISSYGQSAPLYVSASGGDGLESIFAQTNNGNVNAAGVQLSEEARLGTIAKACLWARAVCDSSFHGYDDGQVRERDCWGIAKENSPGTGDYCCFSLAECAYYFAGVNLLGECLGNPAAAVYPPFSTQLFAHGGVSFWGDTQPWAVSPRGSVNVFPKCGFTSIGKQDVYQAGDIAISFFGGQQHMELVIQAGTAQTCQVAEAYGPGSGGRKGGDQSGVELTVKNGFYKPGSIAYVYRFTGAGVVLNTVGLQG